MTKESGYRPNGLTRSPWFYSVLVIVMWGLVPNLAKAADFPGGFTTFWVNVFSAVGVLAIMVLGGHLPQFKATYLLRRFVVLSVIWPLAYSISYFTVIKLSSGSLATLMNYMWPLFSLLLLSRTMKIPRIGIFLTVVGFVCVAATVLIEGNISLILMPMVLGLIAPATQAYFNVTTNDERKYPGDYAWLLTFVGAVVTAVGAGLYILLMEQGQFTRGVSFGDLFPLAVIGIGGNSIGFYAFLKAGQMSRTPNQKVWFILSMFMIPFVQVLFLLIGTEPNINPIRIVGIAIVSVGLLIFKLWEHRQKQVVASQT